jgi:glyoxylase-like metal-dependent hydrolase (beta-lactamase superfamily II)
MIPYVSQFDFDYGRCDQVSPLIQRIICANPGPFTYTGTATFIVGRPEAGSKVAVIDPGPVDDAHLQALIEALDGRTVSHILVTHRHRDHAPLSRPLAERIGNPPIYATASTRLPTYVSGPLDEDVDHDFTPSHALSDGQIITGDGWTLEAILTPGHSSDHVVFELREESALFSGDHVMGWSTTIIAPPDGDMADYMASLDKLMARDLQTLWPTHGPPVTEVAPFLLAYRQHRLEREANVLEALNDGPLTIHDMVPHLYAAIDPKLWPAASLSVLAHLIKLVKEGRVIADGEPGLGTTYSRS